MSTFSTRPTTVNTLTIPKKAFYPPQFVDFGKNSKDLFTKKISDVNNHQIAIKSLDSEGKVSFESGFRLPSSSSSSIQGYIKNKHALSSSTSSCTSPLDFELEAQTDPTKASKFVVSAPKLYPGLLAKLTATLLPFSQSTIKAANSASLIRYSSSLEFVGEGFALNAEGLSDLSAAHTGKVSLSAGVEGFSLGGSVEASSSSADGLSDYALAAEYSQPSYAATLHTEQKLDTAVLSYYHKLSANHVVAARSKINVFGATGPTVEIAHDVILDATSSLRYKVEAPTGLVHASLEHRLSSPKLAVNLAASFSPLDFAAKGIKANNFGASLTFGQF